MVSGIFAQLAGVVDGSDTGGDRAENAGGNSESPGERLERVRTAVGYDDADAARLADETGAIDGGERALSGDDIRSAYGTDVGDKLLAQQARDLNAVVGEADDTERMRRIASSARQQAAEGIAPSSYVASHAPLFEDLIDDAFAAVQDGGDPEEAKQDLKAAMRASLTGMAAGADEFDGSDTVEPLDESDYIEELTADDLFESIPYGVFLIDDENTMLGYNTAINRLLGLDADHREFLGRDCRETLAAATYTDNSRHHALADKVVDAPRNADEEWDVERREDTFSFIGNDDIVYGDTSVSVNTEGEETHIDFLAAPIFDDDGELRAVIELVEDRSEAVREQKELNGLVTEVTDTLDSIGTGELSSRADFDGDDELVEDELLDVVEAVNGMAENFEQLVIRVEDQTEALAESIARATDSAHSIDRQVEDQTESLEEVSNELESFSATMEEVAASSNEVATAAESALDNAERGVDSGQDAKAVTDEVNELSEQLVDSVAELDEYMAEIGEVVDIIADVADQTNILALNANIEAARVDADGDGFGVVADEVKSLANETQQYTDEIRDRIETVQGQTDTTVEEVERTNDHIREVREEIDESLSALDELSESIEDAAEGIQEVAEANDEQAATVEEVTATVDEVREQAHEVKQETNDIVEEAETQEAAVGTLSERVERLSTDATENDGDGFDETTAEDSDD
ncbi:transducer protein Htr31 [Natronomonas pharaonis DSM 2160]|uniref:Transducer protein Htr31 n=1 Tax=Natronomonas pharaonis (strain ATCC 35678 / DSM 2160 / CIP 103997 / JCM 8858 / NBRC 14720 / NCIMB 2260 / Gabara) TaxID=348780 RepID=A0A1U7EX43_NATPD|nr:methyl-accepting chemotaxis protein [Natronomonas pharaonis]CAI49697.1 transducer protein Htr31 [Natronomonas pharaonis DSM 2160]